MEQGIVAIAAAAKQGARKLALLSSGQKQQALRAMAEALECHAEFLLAENAKDVAVARQKGTAEAMIDRLALTVGRIQGMSGGLRQVADLPDPIGESPGMVKRPNGLLIGKVRVPLGVIGIIYESRPNVTADAAGLCLKTGNAVILRGGSEAIHSNTAIIQVLREAAEANGIPAGAIGFIASTDRQAVLEMLRLNQYIDVIIPRGGTGLIKTVVENSTVPVIETGTGVCHVFVDAEADLEMAQAIAFNAKVSRPSVCNSMETLLVHQSVAEEFLPRALAEMQAAGVEVRGCPRTQTLFPAALAATETDWATEFNDLILAVRVVDSFTEAVDHIDRYSTKHSEAIVTQNYARAMRFHQTVDAAAVYVNASTRFTDGEEFGFGAEIGISTQKLHARGPMGLTELTSIKYIVFGDGQIR